MDARKYGNIGDTNRDMGRLKGTEALQEVVLQKRRRVLGDNHLDTLKSMSSLAFSYRALGRLNDAEALEAVVEIDSAIHCRFITLEFRHLSLPLTVRSS